jgi:hypothetical protein
MCIRYTLSNSALKPNLTRPSKPPTNPSLSPKKIKGVYNTTRKNKSLLLNNKLDANNYTITWISEEPYNSEELFGASCM